VDGTWLEIGGSVAIKDFLEEEFQTTFAGQLSSNREP
jgi:hypothetical protein